MKNPLNQKYSGAMQYAHEAYGFDFCKPYKLYEGIGKFTNNSIVKAIGESLSNGICLLFMTSDSRSKGFSCVRVMSGKFDKDVIHPYRFGGDTFYLSKCFDDARKRNNSAYFVVFQSYEHLDKRIIDDLNRFRYGADIVIYNSPYTISRHHATDAFTRYYNVNHKHSEKMQTHDGSVPAFHVAYGFKYKEHFDKSGYDTTTNSIELAQRLAKYKREKSVSHDYGKLEAVIEKHLEKLRVFLRNKLDKMNTNEDIRTFDAVSNVYTNNLSAYKRHNNTNWRSISDHEHYLKHIIEKLEETIIRYNV